MKKLGRKQSPEAVLEELLMEIQATAMEGAELMAEDQQVREMFKRIVKNAFLTQDVKNGLLTPDYRFNSHLLRLMDDENLN